MNKQISSEVYELTKFFYFKLREWFAVATLFAEQIKQHTQTLLLVQHKRQFIVMDSLLLLLKSLYMFPRWANVEKWIRCFFSS